MSKDIPEKPDPNHIHKNQTTLFNYDQPRSYPYYYAIRNSNPYVTKYWSKVGHSHDHVSIVMKLRDELASCRDWEGYLFFREDPDELDISQIEKKAYAKMKKVANISKFPYQYKNGITPPTLYILYTKERGRYTASRMEVITSRGDFYRVDPINKEVEWNN